jgi:hypothetical protein
MRRYQVLLVLFVLLSASLHGAEIVLKDGSKITGKLVGLTDKVVEVDSTYGRLQVPRTEIVSITFPENVEGSKPQEPTWEQKPLKKIEDSITDGHYNNHTANFTLEVPKQWALKPELVKQDVVGALGDQLTFGMVLQERYTGSMESYKGLFELQKQRAMSNYEKVNESATTIDGRPAMLMTFKGISAAAKNLPIEFEAALIQYDGEFVQVIAWSVEPLFKDWQPAFEKMLRSFHRTAVPPPPPASARP